MKTSAFFGLMTGIIAFGFVLAGISTTVVIGGQTHDSGWSFERFFYLLQQGWFQASLVYSLGIAFASSVFSTVLGTILAWQVRQLLPTFPRLSGMYRLPLIWPHVLVAFFVLLILSDSGLLASFFHQLGWISSPQDFPPILYGGTGFGLIVAYVVKETPFAALMVLALLQRLDPRLLQTARMLGASRLYIFFKIVIPHIQPAVQGSFVILLLYTFGAYDIPFLLGESRPGMIGLRAYDLYFQRDLSERPQAMATLSLMALSAFLVAVLFFALQAKRKDDSL